MQKMKWGYSAFHLVQRCRTKKRLGKCDRICRPEEAEDEAVSFESLDNWLKNTSEIYKLHLANGDANLALDRIEFIVDKIIEYKIKVSHFIILVNGYEQSEWLVRIIKKLHKYMSLKWEIAWDVTRRIHIVVNDECYYCIDAIYQLGSNPGSTVKYYQTELMDYATVIHKINAKFHHLA